MSCDESEYLTRFLGGGEFAITDELCCLETLYEPLQDSDMLLESSEAAVASSFTGTSCDSKGTAASSLFTRRRVVRIDRNPVLAN